MTIFLKINSLHFENLAWQSHENVVGIDEAGRGAWAGPVVAAAVVFPRGLIIDGVDDSKKLKPTRRDALFAEVTESCLSFGVGIVDHKTVDAINILQATRKAMLIAVSELKITPHFLLIDGNTEIATTIPQKTIIDGDAISFTIAAASIIAKVTRDRLMVALAQTYPGYGFESHKGYGTKQHQDALRDLGCSPIHRLTYKPVALRSQKAGFSLCNVK